MCRGGEQGETETKGSSVQGAEAEEGRNAEGEGWASKVVRLV